MKLLTLKPAYFETRSTFMYLIKLYALQSDNCTKPNCDFIFFLLYHAALLQMFTRILEPEKWAVDQKSVSPCGPHLSQLLSFLSTILMRLSRNSLCS